VTPDSGHPLDYDQYAGTYAWTREAVPWVLDPLARSAGLLPPGSTLLEAGCGTGNYVGALAALRSDLGYIGFDISRPMLEVARSRAPNVQFLHGDAAKSFPCDDGRCQLVFAVDVVHHLEDLERFFQESRRVLAPDGRLIIVTDSEESMRARSLTRFFPEILALERKRYPDPEQLRVAASKAGLALEREEPAIGDIPLTDEFLAKLEAKCASSMRLLPAEVHAAGMERVRAARAEGAQWRSHYIVLHFLPS
jgi:SAM-dependent methyltransferase